MESKEKNTTLLLKNRTALSLTGVSDIISSDESSVYLDTIDGGLIIEGTELHIISMNTHIEMVEIYLVLMKMKRIFIMDWPLV